MKQESSIGYRWSTVRNEMFTKEEVAESDLRVALIGEIIKARREKGISQRELGKISGVKQPVIARMENGSSIPNLNTVIKVLASLGKTLYIGDLKKSLQNVQIPEVRKDDTMSERRLNNTIFLMYLVTENYCEKHKMTTEEFLKLDAEHGVLNYVAECPDVFDSLTNHEMVEEVEQYVAQI